MRRLALPTLAIVAVALAAVAWAGGAGDPAAKAQPGTSLTPLQQRLMSGFASRALEERTAPGLAPRVQGMRQAPGGVGSTSETGCPANRGANVRVNQTCLNLERPRPAGAGPGAERDGDRPGPERPGAHGRRSQNDYRRGDAGCYTAYSSNGGRTWTDSTPPMGFTRGASFGGLRPRVLAGRRRHLAGVGHQGQRLPVLPGVHARRRRSPTTRTSRVRSTCSARRGPAARRGTSPAGRWPSTTTWPARATCCSTSST